MCLFRHTNLSSVVMKRRSWRGLFIWIYYIHVHTYVSRCVYWLRARLLLFFSTYTDVHKTLVASRLKVFWSSSTHEYCLCIHSVSNLNINLCEQVLHVIVHVHWHMRMCFSGMHVNERSKKKDWVYHLAGSEGDLTRKIRGKKRMICWCRDKGNKAIYATSVCEVLVLRSSNTQSSS
jgi:hypothetical protein